MEPEVNTASGIGFVEKNELGIPSVWEISQLYITPREQI